MKHVPTWRLETLPYEEEDTCVSYDEACAYLATRYQQPMRPLFLILIPGI